MKKIMRVAFIGQKGIPIQIGGVERHVEELATRLVSKGCDVIVYTRPQHIEKELKEYKGVRLISLPTIHTKHLDALVHTFLACFDVRKHKVDIIHFHSIGPSLLIWLAKLLNPKVSVVATFHAQCYRHKKWGIIAKTVLRTGELLCCVTSDFLIVVSRNLKERVFRKYKRVARYIPNGVPNYEGVEIKEIKKWGLKEGGYILYAGRLTESKGLHYLIEAYRSIKTDKKLVIAGDELHPEGYEKRLKKMANEDPNIIFTGRLEGNGRPLAELLTNSYLFVHPSEIEGLSITLLETMSYGKAALVSNISENIEAIGDAGFSFESNNTADLKAKLERLLNNPEEVHKKGIEAKARVKEHYSWEVISDSVLKVYRELKTEKCQKKELFPRFEYIKNVLGGMF